MNKVVIYPGRFQPMLSHHVKVYEHLQAEFPGAKVLIGTADKVEGERSPFNFDEKREIAKAQGINPDNLVYAKSPYVHTFYTQIEQDSTVAIFAVGDKDKERFPMTNVDPETGLDMKVKPNKESGKLEAKYYQMINTYDEDNPVPMKDRGYLYYVPNILGDKQEVESASAFRSALINAPDQDAAKEVFKRQFKEYNEDIFNLVYNKIVGVKMSEELNILKKLAGLELDESAPVEFETSVNVKDIEFTPPSKSSSFHSIANRFPEGSDVNDPEVKKEEFINALLKTPASLLSEINERISPSDDNGLAAGDKLNTIVRSLSKESNSITTLSDDDKKFVLGIVKKAIKEMDLHAGDETPKYDDMKDTDFDAETEESLDLSDIRNDYGIEEDEEIAEGGERSIIRDAVVQQLVDTFGESPGLFADNQEELVAKMYSDLEAMDVEDVVDPDMVHGGQRMGDFASGGVLNVIDSNSAIEDALQHINLADLEESVEEIEEGGDCYHCKGDDPDCEHCDGDGYVKFDDDPNEPSQEEIDDNEAAYKKYIGKHKKDESIEEGEGDLYDKLIGLKHDEEAYAKACGLSMKELDDEMGEISRDLGLHMDDDREAIIMRHAEDQEKEKNNVKESSEDSGEGSISDMSDEDLMDYVGQKEEDLVDDIQQHIAPDFLHKDNYEESFEKYREEVLEPAAHDISQDAADGMEPADADYEESVEDTSNKALEAAMEELKKLAGLEEGECPKCGNKKHKLMACSSCGCS